MKKGVLFILLCIVTGLYLIPKKSHSPQIITTFSILEDLTRQVVGEVPLSIKSLVPLNVDPHTYQLKPQDAVHLEAADLIITNGAGFEGWLERLTTIRPEKILIASNGLTYRRENSKKKSTLDPHLWHSIPNAIVYITNIKNALVIYDPQHKETYEQNAKNYIEMLHTLHKELKELFNKIPKQKRRVVTTHDAFWYFGHEYGIEFIAPIGVSTEQEPSAQDIKLLIDTIRKENIKAIFVENLANSKQLQQIAEETNSPTSGILYADSLSQPDAPDYITMMHYNAHMIFEKLRISSF